MMLTDEEKAITLRALDKQLIEAERKEQTEKRRIIERVTEKIENGD